MKYNIIILPSLLLVFLLSSCDFAIDNNPINELFHSKTEQLTGQIIMIPSDSTSNVFSMVLLDSILITSSPSGRHLFDLIDIKNEIFLGRYGKKGGGPGELGFPSFIEADPVDDNKYWIFSKRDFAIYESTKENILNYSNPTKTDIQLNPNIQRIQKIRQDQYIANGIFPNRIALLDYKGDTNITFGHYPFENEFKNYNYPTLAMAFQGKFAVHHTGMKAVLATSNSANLDFIDLTNLDKPNIYRQLHFWKPSFQDNSKENSISTALLNDNKFGFRDIKVTSKYIYTLFSGRTFDRYDNKALEGNQILVFDWEGNPVKRYQLDYDIKAIEVTPNNSVLYAFSDLEQPTFLKYVLSSN